VDPSERQLEADIDMIFVCHLSLLAYIGTKPTSLLFYDTDINWWWSSRGNLHPLHYRRSLSLFSFFCSSNLSKVIPPLRNMDSFATFFFSSPADIVEDLPVNEEKKHTGASTMCIIA
jgi:hypothetical protein